MAEWFRERQSRTPQTAPTPNQNGIQYSPAPPGLALRRQEAGTWLCVRESVRVILDARQDSAEDCAKKR